MSGGEDRGTHRGDHARGHPGAHHDHGWSVADAIAMLEDPERRKTLDPEAFWDRVGLPRGSRVAEVGAGTGYFAAPAARRVGAEGRVFAIDLSTELVAYLTDRAAREGLPALQSVLAQPGRIPLPAGSVEVLLFANVLHDLSDDSLAAAVRLAAPGARLINLDWRKTGIPFGPPPEIRLSPAEAAARLGGHGFHPFDTFEPGPYHYAAQFRRSPEPSSPKGRPARA